MKVKNRRLWQQTSYRKKGLKKIMYWFKYVVIWFKYIVKYVAGYSTFGFEFQLMSLYCMCCVDTRKNR